MSQADTMNMLEHTGITAATTVAVKTGLAALSKCITVAKDMYNAPTELEALEEEVGLVRMLVEDMDSLRNNNSASTTIQSLWWKLDSKVKEVEGFISTHFRKHTSGSCKESDVNSEDLEDQVNDLPSTSGASINRLAWCRHAQEVLRFRNEMKELRELLRVALLTVITSVTMNTEKMVSSLVASNQVATLTPTPQFAEKKIEEEKDTVPYNSPNTSDVHAIHSGYATGSVQGHFGISMFTELSRAHTSNIMEPPVSVCTPRCQETSVSLEVQDLWKHSWSPNYPTASPVVVFYFLKWEIPFFLKQFFPAGTLLEHVICITGGPTDAFATSCGEYINWQWPRVGRLLLKAIQAMLRTWTKGAAGDADTQISVEHLHSDAPPHSDDQLDPTRCEPVLPNSEPTYETPCVIIVRGSLQDQQDISCAILWICATIRNPTCNGLALSRVSITGLNQYDLGPFCMKIDLLPLELVAEERSCWHTLFTRGIVTRGFPIPRRNKGRGLEISFPSLASLAACHDLVGYDGGLVAAGLVSVLLPVAMLVEDDCAIQWHLCERIDAAGGKDHSRSEPFRSSIRTLSISDTVFGNATSHWYRTKSPQDLLNRRAFVGWCSKVKVAMGTASVSWKSLRESSLPEGSLERSHVLSYNLSQFYVGSLPGASKPQVCLPPAGITRTILAASNELSNRLTSSNAGLVVLYDNETRRAWAIPETSLILHVVLTYVNQRLLKVFQDGKETSLPYVSSQPDTGAASAQALMASLSLQVQDFTNGSTLSAVSELLQSIYLRMDLAADELKQCSLMASDASVSVRRPLCGWDYMDLVNRPNVAKMKQRIVDRPWSMLVQETNALVLFGKGFGELIRPARSSDLCRSWQTVPSGRDYLSVSVPVLRQIMEKYEDTTANLRWHVPKEESLFAKCGDKHGCECNRLQTLSPGRNGPGQLALLKCMLDKSPSGAVIFGEHINSNGDSRWKLLVRNKSQNESDKSEDTPPSDQDQGQQGSRHLDLNNESISGQLNSLELSTNSLRTLQPQTLRSKLSKDPDTLSGDLTAAAFTRNMVIEDRKMGPRVVVMECLVVK